jgi:hypothetical protein
MLNLNHAHKKEKKRKKKREREKNSLIKSQFNSFPRNFLSNQTVNIDNVKSNRKVISKIPGEAKIGGNSGTMTMKRKI